MNGYSRLALIGGLVAIIAFALAAILLVNGNDSTQRLALFFGLLGLAVPAILGLLKADLAATATSATSNIASALDGMFDKRVRNAVRDVATEPSNTPNEHVAINGDTPPS